MRLLGALMLTVCASMLAVAPAAAEEAKAATVKPAPAPTSATPATPLLPETAAKPTDPLILEGEGGSAHSGGCKSRATSPSV